MSTGAAYRRARRRFCDPHTSVHLGDKLAERETPNRGRSSWWRTTPTSPTWSTCTCAGTASGCIQAADGEAGLAAIAREKPRLAILDVGLPGDLDGLEVCRRVRADGDSCPCSC